MHLIATYFCILVVTLTVGHVVARLILLAIDGTPRVRVSRWWLLFRGLLVAVYIANLAWQVHTWDVTSLVDSALEAGAGAEPDVLQQALRQSFWSMLITFVGGASLAIDLGLQGVIANRYRRVLVTVVVACLLLWLSWSIAHDAVAFQMNGRSLVQAFGAFILPLLIPIVPVPKRRAIHVRGSGEVD